MVSYVGDGRLCYAGGAEPMFCPPENLTQLARMDKLEYLSQTQVGDSFVVACNYTGLRESKNLLHADSFLITWVFPP